MRVTHRGHACLLVEIAGARVLIDPGTFSRSWHQERDLAAVVVTHQHPDHLDLEALAPLLAANPDAVVLAEPEAARQVREAGMAAEDLDGEHRVGPVRLTAVGRQHALIHEEIPRIGNRGVRIEAPGEPVLFHPGDALDGEPGPVDVLAVPLSAPWQRSREMTSFVRRIAAPHAIPIHDALLSPAGREVYLRQARDLGCRQTQLHDLGGEGTLDLPGGDAPRAPA